MVFTHHLSHYTGRFLVLSSRCESQVVHTIQHSPVHWLETVPDIRQGPGYNNGHGIIDIRRFHLRLDIDLHYSAMSCFFVFYHISYYQNKTLKYSKFCNCKR